MISIGGVNKNNDTSSISIDIDKYPDHCPVCGSGIEPKKLNTYYIEKGVGNILEAVYRCPKAACQRTFIARYIADHRNPSVVRFEYSIPLTKTKKEFGETIEALSSDFVRIYNQSMAAEQDGLSDICGPGYRKALEFLIKDYLVTRKGMAAEEVGKKQLGQCIQDDVDDSRIKQVAKRAAWLGNDETHYVRKWESKDVKDLKKLIELVLHWVEAEIATEELMEDMPDKSSEEKQLAV